jgi:hypothetical protein
MNLEILSEQLQLVIHEYQQHTVQANQILSIYNQCQSLILQVHSNYLSPIQAQLLTLLEQFYSTHLNHYEPSIRLINLSYCNVDLLALHYLCNLPAQYSFLSGLFQYIGFEESSIVESQAINLISQLFHATLKHLSSDQPQATNSALNLYSKLIAEFNSSLLKLLLVLQAQTKQNNAICILEHQLKFLELLQCVQFIQSHNHTELQLQSEELFSSLQQLISLFSHANAYCEHCLAALKILLRLFIINLEFSSDSTLLLANLPAVAKQFQSNPTITTNIEQIIYTLTAKSKLNEAQILIESLGESQIPSEFSILAQIPANNPSILPSLLRSPTISVGNLSEPPLLEFLFEFSSYLAHFPHNSTSNSQFFTVIPVIKLNINASITQKELLSVLKARNFSIYSVESNKSTQDSVNFNVFPAIFSLNISEGLVIQLFSQGEIKLSAISFEIMKHSTISLRKNTLTGPVLSAAASFALESWLFYDLLAIKLQNYVEIHQFSVKSGEILASASTKPLIHCGFVQEGAGITANSQKIVNFPLGTEQFLTFQLENKVSAPIRGEITMKLDSNSEDLFLLSEDHVENEGKSVISLENNAISQISCLFRPSIAGKKQISVSFAVELHLVLPKISVKLQEIYDFSYFVYCGELFSINIRENRLKTEERELKTAETQEFQRKLKEFVAENTIIIDFGLDFGVLLQRKEENPSVTRFIELFNPYPSEIALFLSIEQAASALYTLSTPRNFQFIGPNQSLHLPITLNYRPASPNSLISTQKTDFLAGFQRISIVVYRGSGLSPLKFTGVFFLGQPLQCFMQSNVFLPPINPFSTTLQQFSLVFHNFSPYFLRIQPKFSNFRIICGISTPNSYDNVFSAQNQNEIVAVKGFSSVEIEISCNSIYNISLPAVYSADFHADLLLSNGELFPLLFSSEQTRSLRLFSILLAPSYYFPASWPTLWHDFAVKSIYSEQSTALNTQESSVFQRLYNFPELNCSDSQQILQLINFFNSLQQGRSIPANCKLLQIHLLQQKLGGNGESSSNWSDLEPNSLQANRFSESLTNFALELYGQSKPQQFINKNKKVRFNLAVQRSEISPNTRPNREIMRAEVNSVGLSSSNEGYYLLLSPGLSSSPNGEGEFLTKKASNQQNQAHNYTIHAEGDDFSLESDFPYEFRGFLSVISAVDWHFNSVLLDFYNKNPSSHYLLSGTTLKFNSLYKMGEKTQQNFTLAVRLYKKSINLLVKIHNLQSYKGQQFQFCKKFNNSALNYVKQSVNGSGEELSVQIHTEDYQINPSLWLQLAVSVEFCPKITGNHAANLFFYDNSLSSTLLHSVELRGAADYGDFLSGFPDSIAFPPLLVNSGQKNQSFSFLLQNHSNSTRTIHFSVAKPFYFLLSAAGESKKISETVQNSGKIAVLALNSGSKAEITLIFAPELTKSSENYSELAFYHVDNEETVGEIRISACSAEISIKNRVFLNNFMEKSVNFISSEVETSGIPLNFGSLTLGGSYFLNFHHFNASSVPISFQLPLRIATKSQFLQLYLQKITFFNENQRKIDEIAVKTAEDSSAQGAIFPVILPTLTEIQLIYAMNSEKKGGNREIHEEISLDYGISERTSQYQAENTENHEGEEENRRNPAFSQLFAFKYSLNFTFVQPIHCVPAEKLDFGVVFLEKHSEYNAHSREIQFFNRNQQRLARISLILAQEKPFFSLNSAGNHKISEISVEPEQFCTISVIFSPENAGEQCRAQLIITELHNFDQNQLIYQLEGLGTVGKLNFLGENTEIRLPPLRNLSATSQFSLILANSGLITTDFLLKIEENSSSRFIFFLLSPNHGEIQPNQEISVILACKINRNHKNSAEFSEQAVLQLSYHSTRFSAPEVVDIALFGAVGRPELVILDENDTVQPFPHILDYGNNCFFNSSAVFNLKLLNSGNISAEISAEIAPNSNFSIVPARFYLEPQEIRAFQAVYRCKQLGNFTDLAVFKLEMGDIGQNYALRAVGFVSHSNLQLPAELDEGIVFENLPVNREKQHSIEIFNSNPGSAIHVRAFLTHFSPEKQFSLKEIEEVYEIQRNSGGFSRDLAQNCYFSGVFSVEPAEITVSSSSGSILTITARPNWAAIHDIQRQTLVIQQILADSSAIYAKTVELQLSALGSVIELENLSQLDDFARFESELGLKFQILDYMKAFSGPSSGQNPQKTVNLWLGIIKPGQINRFSGCFSLKNTGNHRSSLPARLEILDNRENCVSPWFSALEFSSTAFDLDVGGEESVGISVNCAERGQNGSQMAVDELGTAFYKLSSPDSSCNLYSQSISLNIFYYFSNYKLELDCSSVQFGQTQAGTTKSAIISLKNCAHIAITANLAIISSENNSESPNFAIFCDKNFVLSANQGQLKLKIPATFAVQLEIIYSARLSSAEKAENVQKTQFSQLKIDWLQGNLEVPLSAAAATAVLSANTRENSAEMDFGVVLLGQPSKFQPIFVQNMGKIAAEVQICSNSEWISVDYKGKNVLTVLDSSSGAPPRQIRPIWVAPGSELQLDVRVFAEISENFYASLSIISPDSEFLQFFTISAAVEAFSVAISPSSPSELLKDLPINAAHHRFFSLSNNSALTAMCRIIPDRNLGGFVQAKAVKVRGGVGERRVQRTLISQGRFIEVEQQEIIEKNILADVQLELTEELKRNQAAELLRLRRNQFLSAEGYENSIKRVENLIYYEPIKFFLPPHAEISVELLAFSLYSHENAGNLQVLCDFLSNEMKTPEILNIPLQFDFISHSLTVNSLAPINIGRVLFNQSARATRNLYNPSKFAFVRWRIDILGPESSQKLWKLSSKMGESLEKLSGELAAGDSLEFSLIYTSLDAEENNFHGIQLRIVNCTGPEEIIEGIIAASGSVAKPNLTLQAPENAFGERWLDFLSTNEEIPARGPNALDFGLICSNFQHEIPLKLTNSGTELIHITLAFLGPNSGAEVILSPQELEIQANATKIVKVIAKASPGEDYFSRELIVSCVAYIGAGGNDGRSAIHWEYKINLSGQISEFPVQLIQPMGDCPPLLVAESRADECTLKQPLNLGRIGPADVKKFELLLHSLDPVILNAAVMGIELGDDNEAKSVLLSQSQLRRQIAIANNNYPTSSNASIALFQSMASQPYIAQYLKLLVSPCSILINPNGEFSLELSLALDENNIKQLFSDFSAALSIAEVTEIRHYSLNIMHAGSRLAVPLELEFFLPAPLSVEVKELRFPSATTHSVLRLVIRVKNNYPFPVRLATVFQWQKRGDLENSPYSILDSEVRMLSANDSIDVTAQFTSPSPYRSSSVDSLILSAFDCACLTLPVHVDCIEYVFDTRLLTPIDFGFLFINEKRSKEIVLHNMAKSDINYELQLIQGPNNPALSISSLSRAGGVSSGCAREIILHFSSSVASTITSSVQIWNPISGYFNIPVKATVLRPEIVLEPKSVTEYNLGFVPLGYSKKIEFQIYNPMILPLLVRAETSHNNSIFSYALNNVQLENNCFLLPAKGRATAAILYRPAQFINFDTLDKFELRFVAEQSALELSCIKLLGCCGGPLDCYVERFYSQQFSLGVLPKNLTRHFTIPIYNDSKFPVQLAILREAASDPIDFLTTPRAQLKFHMDKKDLLISIDGHTKVDLPCALSCLQGGRFSFSFFLAVQEFQPVYHIPLHLAGYIDAIEINPTLLAAVKQESFALCRPIVNAVYNVNDYISQVLQPINLCGALSIHHQLLPITPSLNKPSIDHLLAQPNPLTAINAKTAANNSPEKVCHVAGVSRSISVPISQSRYINRVPLPFKKETFQYNLFDHANLYRNHPLNWKQFDRNSQQQRSSVGNNTTTRKYNLY